MAVQEIRPGLFRIAGFANTYLLDGPEGMTLIDTGLPNRAKAVLDALAGNYVACKHGQSEVD